MNNTGGTSGIEYQKIVTVDDCDYKLHVFMASRAFKLGARVSKFLGEPIAAMASASGDESKVNDALPLAVKALMNNLHEDEVWSLVNELMTCVTYEGKSLNVDNHFKGRLGHLLKVAIKVVEFQFSDFSSAIGQAVAGAMGKAKG